MMEHKVEDLYLNNAKGFILDLGGVIENIAPAQTVQAFKKLGVTEPEQIFTIVQQDHIVDRFETGKISESEFFALLQQRFNINATEAEIKDAWCAMLKGTSKKTIEALKKLRKHYPLYLLSNTNYTHHKKINASLGFEIESLFDHCFFSFIEGKRKPDITLFQDVVTTSRIKPYDLIFIDDLEKNIMAAKSVGIMTVSYETNYPLYDFLSQCDLLTS